MVEEPKKTEVESKEAEKPEAGELDENTLDNVSGGLNPQPLPPRWRGGN